ncbi:MAG: hypothetical protein K9N48_00495 [Verrucomicrobia bacterium]|nr:hypothetical protein [Verrucomicrobiota bacterium]MCF7707753.1 hypothetical protein [Verrucomicrobiota bacterium]
MNYKTLILILAAGLFWCPDNTEAQYVITDFGGGTIDFTGYAGAGFQSNPTDGQLDSDTWSVSGLSDGDLDFGGTATSGDFARGEDTAGAYTGGLYSFTDSAINGGSGSFGIQPTGSDWTSGSLTLKIRNETGSTLTGLGVGYEIWVNNDEDRANSFNFSYSSDNSSYSSVSSLAYTSPAGHDGEGFVKNDRLTSLTGLSVEDGGDFYLRWMGKDMGGGGSRDEFALDNVSLTAVPEPAEYGMAAGAGLLAFVLVRYWRRRRPAAVSG